MKAHGTEEAHVFMWGTPLINWTKSLNIWKTDDLLFCYFRNIALVTRHLLSWTHMAFCLTLVTPFSCSISKCLDPLTLFHLNIDIEVPFIISMFSRFSCSLRQSICAPSKENSNYPTATDSSTCFRKSWEFYLSYWKIKLAIILHTSTGGDSILNHTISQAIICSVFEGLCVLIHLSFSSLIWRIC